MTDLSMIPSSFMLNGYEWIVTFVPDLLSKEDDMGQCKYRGRQILLAPPDLERGPESIVEVFYHELIHAIRWQSKLRDIENPGEEMICNLLGNGLMQAMTTMVFEHEKLKIES